MDHGVYDGPMAIITKRLRSMVLSANRHQHIGNSRSGAASGLRAQVTGRPASHIHQPVTMPAAYCAAVALFAMRKDD